MTSVTTASAQTQAPIQKNTSAPCPCGSGKTQGNCCLPLIQGSTHVTTAEQLLRSRYTAFTLGEIDYILATHHSKTRNTVDRSEIEAWSKNSVWKGLEILDQAKGSATDEQGEIRFCARFFSEGKDQEHWEHAVFERENGAWKFLDAQGMKPSTIRRMEPKIGRNDPCHCGSGKKFKKCHGTG